MSSKQHDSLFHLLPTDIWRDIIHDWIRKGSIRTTFAALDIAMCNKEYREKYLTCLEDCALSFLGYQYLYASKVEGKFQLALKWFSSRKVKLVHFFRADQEQFSILLKRMSGG